MLCNGGPMKWVVQHGLAVLVCVGISHTPVMTPQGLQEGWKALTPTIPHTTVYRPVQPVTRAWWVISFWSY